MAAVLIDDGPRVAPSQPLSPLSDRTDSTFASALSGYLTEEESEVAQHERESQQHAEKLVGDIKNALAAGRLFQCHTLTKRLCRELCYTWQETATWLLPYDIDLIWLEQQYEAVRHFLQELTHNDPSWNVVSTGKLKSWYKQTKGTRIHSQKFEAPFHNVHLHQLLALAREFDLMKQWNRYCTDCMMLCEPSALEAYVYASIWLPFPFAHPEAILRTRGWDLCEEHGCFVITVESVKGGEVPGGADQLPQPSKKRKPVYAHPGTCVMFKPLPPAADGSPQTHGACIAHIDPNLPMVPSWLVEFVMTLMTPLVYKQMQRLVVKSFKDPNSEFSQRVEARSDLYPMLRKWEAHILMTQ